jgi:hypothetical protein
MGHVTALPEVHLYDDCRRPGLRAVPETGRGPEDDRVGELVAVVGPGTGTSLGRPIYYTTFGELVLIVQSENGAKVFKRPLFPPSYVVSGTRQGVRARSKHRCPHEPTEAP